MEPWQEQVLEKLWGRVGSTVHEDFVDLVTLAIARNEDDEYVRGIRELAARLIAEKKLADAMASSDALRKTVQSLGSDDEILRRAAVILNSHEKHDAARACYVARDEARRLREYQRALQIGEIGGT